MTTRVKIYTDGACSGNPGPGGWCAIVFEDGKEKDLEVLKGGEKLTTNNKMELRAFIDGVKFAKDNFDKPSLEIFSDSKYVIDGIQSWLPNWKKRGWKTSDKKPVKNLSEWQEIDEVIQELDYKLIWVKGHNENKYNEMADIEAVNAIPES